MGPRPFRLAIATATALVTALTLTACAGGGSGSGTDPTATATATATETIDGQPVPVAAGELGTVLATMLGSVTDEFGGVGVDLLQLHPDYWSLYFVDPAEPDTRRRAEFRGSAWSEPQGVPRPDGSSPLRLDAIDPGVLRGAVEAAPGLLEIGDARLSHVSISPDASGQAEYLVALATGDSLGTATFGPDGRMREATPPR